MALEVVTPVGRLVQGGLTLEQQKNDDGTPKFDKDGNPVKQCFLALAIRKDDPGFNPFYAQMHAVARADFPHLFDASGRCTHPQFSWKLQDGDGVDNQGKSVADKPGFAGHWILKLATQFLPNCFHEGKFDATQQIQNPADAIKKGYYIRCSVRIAGNGVKPNETTKKPGIFLSPNLVSLVAFGEVINTGPDANKAFGAAPITTPLPPGASTTPSVAAPAGLAPPALPGVGVGPALPSAGPALPVVATGPALPGVATGPALPGVAAGPALPVAGPVYQMTASALGATRESLLAQGWTDDLLIAQGHMVRVG